jgi:hypothetical protein
MIEKFKNGEREKRREKERTTKQNNVLRKTKTKGPFIYLKG